nr:stalk domain-containing protein [Paenibacillus popilliae]
MCKYISSVTTNVNNANIQSPNWNITDSASYTLTGITSLPGELADRHKAFLLLVYHTIYFNVWGRKTTNFCNCNHALDEPGLLIGGVTYAPVRAVAEAVGAKVSGWVGEERKVNIQK